MLLYKMGKSYIRLNNKFVIKKLGKYIQTDITDPDEWKSMNDKQKKRCKGKDVTKKIKELLKKYGERSNMNFRLGPSKKKIRTKRKSRGKKIKGGWPPPRINLQSGGGWGFKK